MFLISYNTNGLRELSLKDAIKEVGKAGYDGIEISLHPIHLNPFEVTKNELLEIRKRLEEYSIKPVCLSTGFINLLSEEPYEPSLLSKKNRQQRIELIWRTMEIACSLGSSVVNIASGCRINNEEQQALEERLVEGIQICLNSFNEITLAIEPEPGMFIETSKQAISIIEKINSPRFKLNLDIGHVYCCEPDFMQAIDQAIPYTKHIHIEDIKSKIHRHEIPGDGDIDFESLFKLLNKVGYQHYLSVELYHHSDVWQKALHESKTYLKNIMYQVH